MWATVVKGLPGTGLGSGATVFTPALLLRGTTSDTQTTCGSQGVRPPAHLNSCSHGYSGPWPPHSPWALQVGSACPPWDWCRVTRRQHTAFQLCGQQALLTPYHTPSLLGGNHKPRPHLLPGSAYLCGRLICTTQIEAWPRQPHAEKEALL